MKLAKLVVALSATFALSSAAFADITIGVSLSATGPAASLGIPEKNAFALLPTEIGGEKVRLVVLDDATDPTVATKNARRLVTEERVDAIIGSSSTPATAAMAEVAHEAKTPLVTMSPVSLPAERNEWVFRTPQQNEVMASALVAHMKSKGYKTLGFIGFSDAYGEDWLNSVTKHAGAAGIQLAVVERYNRNDTSVTGQVLKVMAAKPDAILIGGAGTPAALPQKSLKEKGYKGIIYQTHGVANNDFLRVCGKDCEDTVLPTGPVLVATQLPADNPVKKSAMEYVTKYEAVHGKGSVSSFGGHAWDAGVLLQNAIPVALKSAQPGTKEFRKALRDALESSKNLAGAHGIFNMTPNDHQGFDQRARVMVTIENNTWKLLK